MMVQVSERVEPVKWDLFIATLQEVVGLCREWSVIATPYQYGFEAWVAGRGFAVQGRNLNICVVKVLDGLKKYLGLV